MSQQYGLSQPKKDAPKFVKLSAFDSDSDSDTTGSTSKKPNVNMSLIQKRQIARAHNAALTEDPTVFQYDELYDNIKSERETAKVVKKNEQKSAKYISKLLESADKRKKEYERRIERQVQKEREEEGEMYRDKEAFITSSYKQKLEEMKKAEEEEKRFDYLEAIGDVTKQRDLGGFYRHLYEQKMGSKASVDTTNSDTAEIQQDMGDDALNKKENKDLVKKERVYRKRKSTTQDASDEEESGGIDPNSIRKKAHLQSNLDADSDFSIDSESDEEPKIDNDPVNVHQPTDVPTKNESKSVTTTTEPEIVKDEKPPSNDTQIEESQNTENVICEEVANGPKIDKKKIWEKRTVGDVLVVAIQRYFERKLLREV